MAISFSALITDYIRMMGYATIALCIVYSIKLKRYHMILLIGDLVLVTCALISVITIIFGVNHNGTAVNLFTLGVFLSMVLHLINVLRT